MGLLGTDPESARTFGDEHVAVGEEGERVGREVPSSPRRGTSTPRWASRWALGLSCRNSRPVGSVSCAGTAACCAWIERHSDADKRQIHRRNHLFQHEGHCLTFDFFMIPVSTRITPSALLSRTPARRPLTEAQVGARGRIFPCSRSSP